MAGPKCSGLTLGTSAWRWRLDERRCAAIFVTEIAEKRKATADHSAAPPGDGFHCRRRRATQELGRLLTPGATESVHASGRLET